MKIIVAGAGVMGLACAWRLASAEAQVHIIDPREPGRGATRASLGALWPTGPLSRGPAQEFDRASLWRFEDFVAKLAQESGRAVSYRRLGRMEILNSAKAKARAGREAEAAQREWPGFGASSPTLEVLDFAAAREINPGVAAFSHGAMVCRATAQVNVHELVDALEEAGKRKGVVFHQGVSATGLLRDGQKICGVKTSAGDMEADAVLIAAGAWTPLISPDLAEIPPITPAKGQGLAVAMPASRPLRTILKSGPIYLIPWDDEVLVGATTEPEAGFDESTTAAAREELLRGAAALVPALKDAPVRRHWAGLRPASRDNLPVMGPMPRSDGGYICAGHYKTGIAMAPLASEMMARLILEKKTPAELQPFVPARNWIKDKPSPANP